ncbi:MAG: 1-(5-phosphoribosyl)-5-[(5-phosphoribosylamino)methylideneamino]imidazole-4-carboxamide isomerase [Succinivibrio sp.]|nr:1-(5-phosphoribosyl)-5-[(5-phosphoribosylamino)methylideneamino]imidazole-4-carboxamide isomerase [Succinivibrio sp.]
MIIPALDLSGGQVVRLRQGDYAQKTVFDIDPVQRVVQSAKAGAELIHLVDLDGAKDPQQRQRALIATLVKACPIPLQTGGGIRSAFDVENLLELGVARVVIGSTAVTHPELVRGWLQKFGPEHFTLALDVRVQDGKAFVATHGWVKTSGTTLEEVLQHFIPFGVAHLLVTDISKDGMLQGANNSLYARLAKAYPQLELIASGGISSLDDIRAVKQAGATSVVLGRALLEGRFTLEEALACWQNA